MSSVSMRLKKFEKKDQQITANTGPVTKSDMIVTKDTTSSGGISAITGKSMEPMPTTKNGSMAKDRLDKLVNGHNKSLSANIDIENDKEEIQDIRNLTGKAKAADKDLQEKIKLLKRLQRN